MPNSSLLVDSCTIPCEAFDPPSSRPMVLSIITGSRPRLFAVVLNN